LFEALMNMDVVLLIGCRRSIWSCSYEYWKSRNGCFFDTYVISSYRWILCPGMHKKCSK
jgi:hypothetical protein